MSVLRDFLRTLHKMFAADLGLTLGAVGTVGICVGLRATHLLTTSAIPGALTGGVLGMLTIAVRRGSRR
jgi:hypothetical protein